MDADFRGWLRQRGGFVSPRIDLFTQQPGGDRAVTATADIQEEEQLLLVPVAATLHLAVAGMGGDRSAMVPATCRPELAGFLESQQPRLSPFLATVCMLLAELAAADNADNAAARAREGGRGEGEGADGGGWGPYFATLPPASNCLLNWSDDERRLLAGTSLGGQHRSTRDIFAEQVAPKLAARPDLFPPGRAASYEAFARAADMVQTRAFHLQADNWLTGASQESTDELYLIPGVDMLNHASDPALRNTSLALCHGEAQVTLEDGSSRSFTNFFSMRAERAIPAGSQVLHTYGDLADAQLLQTYGFIDLPPSLAAAGGTSSSSSGGAAAQQAKANPHNYAALPLATLLASAKFFAAATQLWPAKRAGKILAARLAHLAAAGLLQPDDPGASQLLISAANPLPDELLTIVQVLMMTEPEFSQLQAADPQPAPVAPASAGCKGSGSAAAAEAPAAQEEGAQQAAAAPGSGGGLELGRELLQDEFGELVATVLLHAAGECLKRYPPPPGQAQQQEQQEQQGQPRRGAKPGRRAKAQAPAALEPGSRAWLAACLAAGERAVLAGLKREATLLLYAAAGDEDEEESGSGSSGSSSEGEPLSESSSGEQRAAPARPGARAQRGRGARQGKGAGAGGTAGKASAGTDSRPHYGSMTGPREADVWQSDGSEDKVGYSESDPEEEEEGPAPHRHTQGAGHSYEVGASGAVRERTGHMLGPDEAALLESDDSDKVGYADGEPDSSGAGAPEPGARRGRGRGAGSDGAAAPGGAPGRKKRQRRGLGYSS